MARKKIKFPIECLIVGVNLTLLRKELTLAEGVIFSSTTFYFGFEGGGRDAGEGEIA